MMGEKHSNGRDTHSSVRIVHHITHGPWTSLGSNVGLCDLCDDLPTEPLQDITSISVKDTDIYIYIYSDELYFLTQRIRCDVVIIALQRKRCVRTIKNERLILFCRNSCCLLWGSHRTRERCYMQCV